MAAPANIPEVYQKFIVKCLQKEPTQLFQTVAEMRLTLKNEQAEIYNQVTTESQTLEQPKSEVTVLKAQILPTEDWREIEKRRQPAEPKSW